jgi:hypothetical protein
MLQAAPEGTAFEIAKGRYSETANFDVYLKGHAGDPLRIDRIGRAPDAADNPALSVALAVQPDVIHGLAEQATMRGRGFLARFLYAVPRSLVGERMIGMPAVPKGVAADYRLAMLALWHTQGSVDDHGRPEPHWNVFSHEADSLMHQFERWLEPQLAEGEELASLAGWANKLAGAAARIAGILHMTATALEGSWQRPVDAATVEKAIRLGRGYLLPHAQAAFGMMGANPKADKAARVWRSICEHFVGSECSEYSESTPPL